MPNNPDKLADKLGVNASNSQVNIENLFVGSTVHDPTNNQDSTIDWQRICRDMLIEREQLTSNRLMISPDMHKTLDIFVDLALVQQKKADKRDEDVLPEHGSQLYEPSRYSESERFEFGRFLKDVLGTQKNEKLTIIGEPGSGKTTLLQKIAFWLLDHTEDLVLWVSLGELKDKPLRDYLTEDWLQDAVMYADSRIFEDWERQFLQRRVWLLLDGLDEMTPETRDALSLKGWVSQARVVITCRLNVWQTNPRIINGFETYRMLEFRPPQVEEFIQKWFIQDEVEGQHLHQALTQPGKERIRDLVRNPLRLTLLCSTWYLQERKLPDTRAELYDQFVDDLYKWKRDRFPTSALQRVELNEKLGELAKEAIDKEQTRFRLKHSLVCRMLGEPDDPNSMLKLALDLGWLNAVGVNPQNPREPVYAFFHATFQEYFATKNISDWDFFIPLEHKDKPVENSDNSGKSKSYRIFEPQWKEVILLWLGRKDINYEKKYNFIDTLLNFDDGCNCFYSHRAFFLAALAVLELPNYPDSAKVIQRIVKWGFGKLDEKNQEWLTYFEPLEQQARITLLSSANNLVVSQLTNYLESVEDKFIRYEIASLLSKIDFENLEAINVLASLLDSNQNIFLRLQASRSLIQICSNHLNAEKTLIELAKKADSEWLRRDAAWALIKSKTNHPVGINSLMKLLCTSKDQVLLWNLRLDEIGMSSPKLLRILFRTSYLSRFLETRSASMGYLLKLIISDKRTLERIYQIIKLTQPFFRLVTSVKKIPSKGVPCLVSIKDLADKVRSDGNKDNRKEAFLELLGFAVDQPDLAILIAKISISNEGSETRKNNVIALCETLEINISLAISVWIDLIRNTKDSEMKAFLAKDMANSGFEDEQINNILADLLENANAQSEYIKYWLAQSLLKLDSTHSESLSTLIHLLEYSENHNMCRWVADDLGEACNESDLVIESLIKSLSKSSSSRISDSVNLGFQRVFNPNSLEYIVNQLKGFLDEEILENNFLLYRNSFEILGYCASRLPYSEFYRVWHS